MPATDGTWRASRFVDARPALIASILVALALGVFLVTRRANGALVEPLAPIPLATAAVLAFAWSVSVRLLLHDETAAWKWAATVALALFAIACSFPADRAIDWLIWLPVFMAYAAAPELLTRATRAPATRSTNTPTHEATILQNLSRSRTADSQEIVEGTLLAEFAPDQRATILHIAFCPPFERLPHVEAEVLDDTDAQVKVAQVLHNGTRLEIRRPAPFDGSLAISIGLIATDIVDN